MVNTELKTLIDLAAEACGKNKAELARRIGVPTNRIHEWKTGVRPCPPEKVALMAAVANLQADQWLTRATLWKHEGTEEGFRLQQALGKSMRAIGAALVLCIAVALGGQFSKADGGLFRTT